MSDERDPPASPRGDFWPDDEPDPDEVGEPVAELRGYAVAVRESLVTGVRRRIERRGLTGDLMDMVWRGGAEVALEWLQAAFEPLRRAGSVAAATPPTASVPDAAELPPETSEDT